MLQHQGYLSDRIGKKAIIVTCCLIGIAGSVTSGTAHSIYQIIGGNILTGLANAGCIVSIAANQEIIPNRFRPYAMGFNQTVASCIAIMGTFIAAAFVKNNTGGSGGWRWAYFFNACFYGLSAVAVFLAYHPPRTLLRQENSLKRLLVDTDFLGFGIFTASLAALIIGLTWGGTTYAWNSARIIAILTVGCIGLVLFGLYEWRFTTSGLLDHRMFGNANFPILLFVCAIDGMLLLGVNVIYAQEIADLFTTDSIRIAVILCPYLITSSLGCLPAGILMGKTKSYRTLLVGALVWTSLWLGLMALLDANKMKTSFAFSALFGIGTAVTTVIPIVALTLSVPSFLLGTAGTLSISCRALGGLIGITIFTAIFNNRLSSLAVPQFATILSVHGNHTPPSALLGALMSGAPHALDSFHLDSDLSALVEAAYVQSRHASWKFVWVALSVLVAFNAAVCCFLKPVRSMMSEHVESVLERRTMDEKGAFEAQG